MARRVWLAMTFVCALGVLAAPARADERVNAIARALRADPVYVSSSLSRAVPPAQVAALRRAVANSRDPAFVVVAPSFGEEPALGTLRSRCPTCCTTASTATGSTSPSTRARRPTRRCSA